ncbi:predicted protein [Streptomyces sp. SPB78]|nr:predicted protein [Streptomyces sp. SPB78]
MECRLPDGNRRQLGDRDRPGLWPVPGGRAVRLIRSPFARRHRLPPCARTSCPRAPCPAGGGARPRAPFRQEAVP